MKITEVKIFPVNEERLKAYVSITIDECFVVRDLKIIQGPNGLFVAMPSKKRKDGQFRDIAHPLNQETRAEIEDLVFDAFESELKAMGESLTSVRRSKNPNGNNSNNNNEDYE
jgi:stage V sporulation protein G